jgi:ribose/xylose/arabinose/galactoside ABC-type transport system permease subunit
MNLSRLLITLGIVLVVLGLLWPWLQKSGLGRLPGDIAIERDNYRFYFPITTSIIISILLTLLFWLFRK